MRLNRIEIIGEYKSIKGTEENLFTYTFQKSAGGYSPLCLVGLNGSGKSNFIELIADIFGYADRYFNAQYHCAEDLPYDFFLDYQIKVEGELKFVKLKCIDSQLKMYFYDDIAYLEYLTFNYESPNRFQALIDVTRADCNFHRLLPDNVIAYSSGHNQGLSSVFAKTQHSFFDVVRKQGVFYREYKKRIDSQKGRDFIEDDAIRQEVSKYIKKTYLANPDIFYSPPNYDRDPENYEFEYDEPLYTRKSRLPIGTFSDHSVNQLIFTSLMVNENDQFKQFLEENIGVTSLESFEIDFRLSDYRDLDFIREEITQRLCKLSSDDSKFNEDTLNGVLAFKLDREFFEKVESLYLERSLFFENLLFINQMVAKRWSRDEKRTLKTSKFEKNVPNVSGGLAPIRFINTKIKLKGIAEPTRYDRLSDGEHQLIQIIGSLILFDHQQSLFILDEPESHFNPEWRIEFIELLNKYVNLENLELMVSTHSPFILSACKSDRVLHFKKDENSNISVNSMDLETYGASFDSLLTSVFDLDVLISKQPLAEIRANLKAYDDGEADGSETLQRLESFGESFELNYRRNKIRQTLSTDYEGES
ncbi:AAA family ATPase [Vibrio aestuarianus]|uniref:AAA family ATPase n=1 Tax=Vibrio aestuarianus TaxID=28171 RepID=UPI00237C8947|nr:AAA family ATPase [Vibrio aestuarianus]MDE1348535.1 AAA family ATPase [Vibrio aestuarianus]